eukprot:g1429.t1
MLLLWLIALPCSARADGSAARCSGVAVLPGTNYEGQNLASHLLPTPAPPNATAVCAALCCGLPSCAAWVLAVDQPAPAAGTSNCTAGSTCCWLKSGTDHAQRLNITTAGTVHRPPPTPTPLPKGGGPCTSPGDCHWGGDCVGGRCRCDPTWTGAHCAALHLLPAPAPDGKGEGNGKGNGLGTYPADAPAAISGLPSNSTFTWGGAVVAGDGDGLYHGFFTEYMHHCPMTYGTWSTSTHIRRATSPSPLGPWSAREVVVPDAAGNPVIARSPDNATWLLYFTNHRWGNYSYEYSQHRSYSHSRAHSVVASSPSLPPPPPPPRDCAGAVDSWGAPTYCSASGQQCATGISLAHAPSLSGPWTLEYDVVKGVSCTNPGAPVFDGFAADGSLLMAYKTWTKAGRCIGLVSASAWDAFPYDTFPLGGGGVCLGAAPDLEDPSNLWMDARGTVHMLLHTNGYGSAAHAAPPVPAPAAAARSLAGRVWAWNATARSYEYVIEYEDGTVLPCALREEPKVVLDPASGLPSALINVCRLDGPGGTGQELPKTAPTAAWPQGEAQHISMTVMQPINTQ